jgi:hypothetical protein
MSTSLVQVCTDAECTSTELVEAYLIAPEDQPALDLLIQTDFQPELAQTGFLGVLLLFVTGFGVGLIIKLLNKLR